MAKKNLASLMSGIMGEREEETSLESSQSVPEKTNISDSNPADTDQVNNEIAPRTKGRPKKTKSEKIEEIRATFIANAEQMRQIKYISLVEGKLLKEVLSDAIASYVSQWEIENGKIKLPKNKS